MSVLRRSPTMSVRETSNFRLRRQGRVRLIVLREEKMEMGDGLGNDGIHHGLVRLSDDSGSLKAIAEKVRKRASPAADMIQVALGWGELKDVPCWSSNAEEQRWLRYRGRSYETHRDLVSCQPAIGRNGPKTSEERQ
jgi:hypothetical protein